MIFLQNPPEFADGGYWFTTPVVIDHLGETPDYSGEYSAQYGTVDGIRYALLRLVNPAAIPAKPVSVEKIISSAINEGALLTARKPRMRVRGR